MENDICVINGPNLNLLAKREPEIYGNKSLDDIIIGLREAYPDQNILHYQSNSEGELVDAIQELGAKCKFGIINAAAYTHTSVAIRDAIKAVECQFIEVHLSNVFTREDFRKHSYISEVCLGVMTGFGSDVYALALEYILRRQ